MDDECTIVGLRAARARQDDTTGVEIRRGVERLLFGDRTGTEAPPRAIGRLVLGETLGAGAHGEVRRARDPLLGRDVAVKLLRPGPLLGGRARARMRREAQALAAVSHAGVVALYDTAIWGDAPCVVMELVDGRDLSKWLRERPRTRREILDVFIGIAEGLHAVHRRGLVHRDVKPANVLVDRHGRPRIADFGLAMLSAALPAADGEGDTGRDLESHPSPRPGRTLTRSGVVLGTPAYMAPEQHEGAQVDARADQYAFCVALWEALHGLRPFQGPDLDRFAAAKRRGPPRVTDRGGRVPPRVQAVIERGLHPDPSARHRDMHAVALELQRAQSGRRGRVLGALGALAVGVAILAIPPSEAPCRAGGSQAQDLWRSRRADVRTAISDTALPWGDATFRRVDADLDVWTGRWRDAYLQTCTDERASGSRTAAMQMQCLDGSLAELNGLVDLLLRADPRLLASAVDAAGELRSVDRCLHEHADPAFAPGEAEIVYEVRTLLRRVHRLARAAMFDEAEHALATAMTRAAEIAGVGIALELQLGAADLDIVRRADASAMRRLEELAWQAVEAERDDLAADAMLALADAYSSERAVGVADEGLRWIERVQPSITRLSDPHTEARFRLIRAGLAQNLGDAATTIRLAQSVLDMPRDVLPESSGFRADAFTALGNALASSGRRDEAERAFRRSLALDEQAVGPGHPRTAAAQAGLGLLASMRNDTTTARVQLSRALELVESTWGETDVRTARIRNNVANVAMLQEDFAEALKQYERVVDTYDAVLGPRHPSTAGAVSNRAYAAANLGRLHEAEAGLRDAIERFDGLHEHPDFLGIAHVRLGSVLEKLGRLDESRAEYEAATVVFGRVSGGTNDADAWSGLARIAEHRDAYETAVEHRRKVMRLREHAPPTSRAVALVNLAQALMLVGERAEATALLERAEPLLPEPRDPLATRAWSLARRVRGKLSEAGLTPGERAPRPQSSSSDRDPRPPPPDRP